MIEFRCHTCDRLLRTADDKAGRSANCPGCGQTLTVPSTPQRDQPFDEPGGEELGEFGAEPDDAGGYEGYDEYESALPRPSRRRRKQASKGQNPLSVISLITGVTGLLIMFPGFCCGCLFLVSLPLDLTAVVTGAIALNQIGNDRTEGKPMAIAGIVCGALAVVVFVALLALGIAINLRQPNQFKF